MVLVGRDLALSQPDVSAVRDDRLDLSWSELNLMLNRAVNALSHTAGRAAVMADNSVETLVAHTALLLAGVSAVPVNAHLTADEAAYLLRTSGATLVLAGPSTVEVARAAADQVGADVIAWRSAGVSSWEQLLESASADEPAPRAPVPPLLFTSGTTGRPKATEIPPTMFPAVDDLAAFLEQVAQTPMHGLGRHLVVGPLHHTGPLTAARLLAAGNPVTVLGRFDAAALLDVATRDEIATSVMVPTHFARLLALPQHVRAAFDPRHLRSVAQTGASCPVEVKRQMIDWWGPVFTESYGATEVGVVASIDSHEWLAHPGSVGRAAPPFEAVVLDDERCEVPAGVSGCLWFRDSTGRGIVYAHTPEGSAVEAPPEPGMFTLGEIGHVDADGYLYITDRSSDMVVSGGVNIYPAEVEHVLADHPGVHDSAGIGLPDTDLGERLVVLVVVSDPALTPGALLTWCRDRLAHYKCPREIVVVEALPRTAMGKIDKRAVRRAHLAVSA